MPRNIERIAGGVEGDPGELPGNHGKMEHQEAENHPEYKSQEV